MPIVNAIERNYKCHRERIKLLFTVKENVYYYLYVYLWYYINLGFGGVMVLD